jgi:CheY-like chemotaxis protein
MSENKVVVYADDDEDDRMFLVESFQHRPDFKLLTFSDGVELIEYVKGNPPCLIVLDINMPRLDGIQIAETIFESAYAPGVPIIMLTTSDKPPEIDRIKNVGARILRKPMSAIEVKRLADTLLEYCS